MLGNEFPNENDDSAMPWISGDPGVDFDHGGFLPFEHLDEIAFAIEQQAGNSHSGIVQPALFEQRQQFVLTKISVG